MPDAKRGRLRLASIDHLKRFAHLHHNVGGIQFTQRHYGPAILCFQEAVRWTCPPAIAALRTVAEAAQQDATDAYNAGYLLEAAALCRQAIEAAPADEPIAKLGRAIAARAYNQASVAHSEDSLGEAADLFSIALELDPSLTVGRDPLAKSLRAVASAHFEAGRVQEALAVFDRLLALGTPNSADDALIHSVQSWLRAGFARQVRELKVGGAVYLLKQLAQLAPKALASDVELIELTGDLSRLLAKHASEQPIAVLDAVLALHPLAPAPAKAS
jgi:tetratricopeptide (TPR) repeat protein